MELLTKTSRVSGSEINHTEIGEQNLVDANGKAERARIEHTVRMLPDAPHHEEAVIELSAGDMSMIVRACFDQRGQPLAMVSLIRDGEEDDDQSYVAVENVPGKGWTATVTSPIRVQQIDPQTAADEQSAENELALAWEREGDVR